MPERELSPLLQFRKSGREAAFLGLSWRDNPNTYDTPPYEAWASGYVDAESFDDVDLDEEPSTTYI